MTSPNQQTIVVGVDYSETGLLALKQAFVLGAGGAVHAVHVVDLQTWVAAPPMLGAVAPTDVSLKDAGALLQRYVQEQIAALQKESKQPGPARVVSHIAVGAPAREIVQLASDLEADLVVVGTHGRRGVQRLLLGSIAEGVVRMATCPVLVERPKTSATDDIPRIEPPCPRCVETRRSTSGGELWCAQHREKHGRRHTYHNPESSTAFPSSQGGLGSVS